MLNKIWLRVSPLLEKEFIRFLLVGGVNTIIGYSVTLFLFYLLKFDYKTSQILNFIICFPIAYTLQAKYAFRTKWSVKRLFAYPISSLPNFFLQFITLILCVEIVHIPEYIAYLISYIVPIPIMFIVVRFLVKAKVDEVKDTQKLPFKDRFLVYCVVYSIFFCIILYFGFENFLFEDNRSLIWYFDGVLQHFPFLYDLSQWVKALSANLSEFPMWSWEMGFGADTIQSYSYYTLGDPFSLLAAVFFPLSQMEFAYNMMAILRIYFVGISLLGYCKYAKLKLMPSVIGSLIMAFSTHILFWGIRHPFFTNGAILLPILFISIEEIFKKRKPYLFIICIAISAINNFYFFYMNSLAIFIYAVVRFFFYVKEDRGRVFWRLFLKVLGFYLLGLSIGAILFIPSTYGFLNTFRASGASLPIGLFDGSTYKDIFTRLISFDFKSGISRITVAGIALPCVLIFFTYKDKKIFSYKILLGVFSLFLCIPFIYSVFNGFSSPNNRWVYIYLVIISFIVAYTIDNKERITKKGFILSIIGTLLYFVLLRANFDLIKTRAVVLPIACIICFYLIIYGNQKIFVRANRDHMRKKSARGIVVDLIILLVVTLNLISNTKLLMLYRYYGSEFIHYNTVQEMYSQDKTSSFDKIDDDDFFRIDYADSRNNKGIVHNFKSTYAYNSIIDKDIIEFFEFNNLRTHLSSSAYMGLDNISGLEALLGVKYYISQEENSPFISYGFTPIYRDKKATIYKNNYFLPLGFVYYNHLPKDKLQTLSSVDRLYAMLDGVVLEEGIKEIGEATAQTYTENMDYEIIEKDAIEIKNNKFIVSKKNGEINIRVKNTQNKEVYLSIDRIFYENLNKDFEVSVKIGNSEKTIETRNVHSPYYVDNRDYLYHIGYTDKEFMDIKLSFSLKGEYRFKDLTFSGLSMENYEDKINQLKETVLEDMEYGNHFVKGNVFLEDKGILYLSIPYTPGWEAFDNGKKIHTFKANTAFTGILLEPGHHEIYLRYKTPLFIPSIFISIAGICVFVYLIYYNRRSKF